MSVWYKNTKVLWKYLLKFVITRSFNVIIDTSMVSQKSVTWLDEIYFHILDWYSVPIPPDFGVYLLLINYSVFSFKVFHFFMKFDPIKWMLRLKLCTISAWWGIFGLIDSLARKREIFIFHIFVRLLFPIFGSKLSINKKNPHHRHGLLVHNSRNVWDVLIL